MRWPAPIRRWFNIPHTKGMPYLCDRDGNKFWIILPTDDDPGDMWLWYRARPAARVQWLWEEERTVVELCDIVINNPAHRSKGLGTQFMHYWLNHVRSKGAQMVYGFVQPEAPDKLIPLIAWYKRQGFTIHEYQGHFRCEIIFQNSAAE